MTSRYRADVLVIGAGVIGLTTAITLAETGSHVLVRAQEAPEETTSAAAGALWGPWMAEPARRAERWAAHTLGVLTGLAGEAETGVRLAHGMDVSNSDRDRPDWFALIPDLRSCTPDELPAGYRHGHSYTAPLVDMPTHLAYLTRRLTLAGGEMEAGRIESLSEAARLAPKVINCTGLGARALIGDRKVFPVRGQHVVVSNPGLTDFLEVDTGDSPDLVAIYPHGSNAVLGGTAEPHVWSRTPDPVTASEILERCIRIEPRLEGADVLHVSVGLRPTRSAIRLGVEAGPTGSIVVHNYGHGGAGVSLSWGCATVAAELARSHGSWA
jgi:D-amino-acid oxidase